MNTTLEKSIHWIEAKGDWLNAILVKETRQALKSRQFVATFMLLLLSSWLISLLYVVMEGDSINYGDAGRQLFIFYHSVLLVAITIIVPFGAFRSLLNEKDMNTYDVLCITSLSPRQIVWGKLLSAMLQVFIYYSAIAPFIAFTALLEGFDFPVVAFVLVSSLLVSMAYSITSLMLCTFASQRHWQAILSIMLLLGLISMFPLWWELTEELFRRNPFEIPEFWWTMALIVAIGLSYCWLFMQITTAQLTFETGNRSTGIRITSAVQQVAIWATFAGMVLYFGPTLRNNVGEIVFGLGIATLAHWSFVGLIASTEEDHLSRRIRNGLPRSKFLRTCLAPLLPGGARGYVYLILNLVLMLCFGFALIQLDLGTSNFTWPGFMGLCALCLYLVFYIGVGALFGRVARRKWTDLKPSHVRVLTVLFMLAGVIGPFILSASEVIRWNPYSIAHISNPVVTVDEILNGRGSADTAFVVLAIASGVVVLLNLSAMSQGMREVIGAPPPPQREPGRAIELGTESSL